MSSIVGEIWRHTSKTASSITILSIIILRTLQYAYSLSTCHIVVAKSISPIRTYINTNASRIISKSFWTHFNADWSIIITKSVQAASHCTSVCQWISSIKSGYSTNRFALSGCWITIVGCSRVILAS